MFWKEFKAFAMRGNVIDMAIGVIIGGAFSKVISSLVDNIIMPPIGLLIGQVDFSHLVFHLSDKVDIRYGLFINNILDFAIVAFVLFFVIRQFNQIMNAIHREAPTTKECPFCVSKIAIAAKKCPNCTSQLT